MTQSNILIQSTFRKKNNHTNHKSSINKYRIVVIDHLSSIILTFYYYIFILMNEEKGEVKIKEDLSPLIIYHINVHSSQNKIIHQHIFVGNLITEPDIKKLNQNSINTSKFKNIINPKPGIATTYHPYLLNFFDNWNIFCYKIQNNTNLKNFYIWINNSKTLLTTLFHRSNKK